MGAVLHCETFDGKLTTDQVRKQYLAHRENMMYEHGTDPYNGTWSTLEDHIVIHNEVLDSYNTAQEFIDQRAEKRGSALAIRYKDVRTEVAKEPTYNGKPSGFGLAINTKTIRSVNSVWDAASRETRFVAADQLTVAHKAKALTLYTDWHTKNRAFDQLRNAVNRICQRLQDVSAPAPGPADFKELQQAIKQRARAHAAEKKAAEKFLAFDIKQAAKIYATKQVDHGAQWLVGGLCAQ